jgi:hypothetical protein
MQKLWSLTASGRQSALPIWISGAFQPITRRTRLFSAASLLWKWRRCLPRILRSPTRFDGKSGKKDLRYPKSGKGFTIYSHTGFRKSGKGEKVLASIRVIHAVACRHSVREVTDVYIRVDSPISKPEIKINFTQK